MDSMTAACTNCPVTVSALLGAWPGLFPQQPAYAGVPKPLDGLGMDAHRVC